MSVVFRLNSLFSVIAAAGFSYKCTVSMNIPRELLAPLQVLLSVSAAAAGHGRPVPPVTRNACLCIRLHQMMSKAGRKQSVFSREWDLGDHRRDPGGPACVSSRDHLPRFTSLPRIMPATLLVTVYFPV